MDNEFRKLHLKLQRSGVIITPIYKDKQNIDDYKEKERHYSYFGLGHEIYDPSNKPSRNRKSYDRINEIPVKKKKYGNHSKTKENYMQCLCATSSSIRIGETSNKPSVNNEFGSRNIKKGHRYNSEIKKNYLKRLPTTISGHPIRYGKTSITPSVENKFAIPTIKKEYNYDSEVKENNLQCMPAINSRHKIRNDDTSNITTVNNKFTSSTIKTTKSNHSQIKENYIVWFPASSPEHSIRNDEIPTPSLNNELTFPTIKNEYNYLSEVEGNDLQCLPTISSGHPTRTDDTSNILSVNNESAIATIKKKYSYNSEAEENDIQCLPTTSSRHPICNEETSNTHPVKHKSVIPTIKKEYSDHSEVKENKCNYETAHIHSVNNESVSPTIKKTNSNHSQITENYVQCLLATSCKHPLFHDETSNIPSVNKECECTVLGSNGTTISKSLLNTLTWDQENYSKSVRILLRQFFTQQKLATHSFSGKLSPAFPNKSVKPPLDRKITEDIVQYAAREGQIYRLSVTQIKKAITSTCSDHKKILLKKKTSLKSLQIVFGRSQLILKIN